MKALNFHRFSVNGGNVMLEVMLVLEDLGADVALERLHVTNAMNGGHVSDEAGFLCECAAADVARVAGYDHAVVALLM